VRTPAASAVALMVAACAGGGEAATTVELTVFAAASLRTALEEVEVAYEAAHRTASLIVATDSSAALRTQIEHGAPADLFLSADTTNPQALVAAGLTDGEAVPFATNRLALVIPAENPRGIQTPADLANDGVRIVAAGDEVPITVYATQLVERLAARPGYPADFAERYAANVVSREDNVQAIVAKLQLGEGDAGIVYATDARAAEGIGTVLVPAEANVAATYAGVVLGASPARTEARALLDWLAASDGQALLGAVGFGPAP
jgi:molybdate transport system substrate-binding protein